MIPGIYEQPTNYLSRLEAIIYATDILSSVLTLVIGGALSTGLVVRASDSESGDPGSILGPVGVLFP